MTNGGITAAIRAFLLDRGSLCHRPRAASTRHKNVDAIIGRWYSWRQRMKTFYGIAVALALTISPPVLRFCAGAEEDPHLIGQFLVAAPTMGDPRFQESVVYLIGHGAEGALGFVVNHPIAEGPLSDLLKALGRDGEAAKGSVTINYGGPVEGEELFVLHSN